jgi:hypothetical protein
MFHCQPAFNEFTDRGGGLLRWNRAGEELMAEFYCLEASFEEPLVALPFGVPAYNPANLMPNGTVPLNAAALATSYIYVHSTSKTRGSSLHK